MRIIFGTMLSAAAIVILTVVFALFGSFYWIKETQRGVLTWNGAFDKIVTPGFNFKIPFAAGVNYFDIDDKTFVADDEESFTFDNQIGKVDLIVVYRVNPSNEGIKEIFIRHGSVGNYEKQVVRPVALKALKNVFSTYTAERAIRSRAQLNNEISDAVTDAINKASIAGSVVRVAVTDISWDPKYMEAINDARREEVKITKERQIEEQKKVIANQRVIEAKGLADAAVATAEGEAKSIKLRGEAEAEAIRLRAAALAQNQNLVLLTQAEKWDGKLPNIMLPNTGVPMLNLNTGVQQK